MALKTLISEAFGALEGLSHELAVLLGKRGTYKTLGEAVGREKEELSIFSFFLLIFLPFFFLSRAFETALELVHFLLLTICSPPNSLFMFCVLLSFLSFLFCKRHENAKVSFLLSLTR